MNSACTWSERLKVSYLPLILWDYSLDKQGILGQQLFPHGTMKMLFLGPIIPMVADKKSAIPLMIASLQTAFSLWQPVKFSHFPRCSAVPL